MPDAYSPRPSDLSHEEWSTRGVSPLLGSAKKRLPRHSYLQVDPGHHGVL